MPSLLDILRSSHNASRAGIFPALYDSVNAQIQCLAELGQGMDTGYAVAVLVQGGGEYADAHAAGDHPQNAAAHTAFGWEAYGQSEFAGAVIHAAGGQGGIDIFCVFRREQLLPGNGMNTVIGEDMGDPCQVPAVDQDGAGTEIAVRISSTGSEIMP